jgi:hypothetical protein
MATVQATVAIARGHAPAVAPACLVCNVPEPGERPRLPAGFVPARTRIKVRATEGENGRCAKDRENGRFRCCLVCGDCHATLYDPCCRSNDLRRRVRYTCADFHSNYHTAPYGSCNSAHFDDHQLHDDLQFAGGQLSNSLSHPRSVVWNSVVWNHDIERYGKYSVFVNLL